MATKPNQTSQPLSQAHVKEIISEKYLDVKYKLADFKQAVLTEAITEADFTLGIGSESRAVEGFECNYIADAKIPHYRLSKKIKFDLEGFSMEFLLDLAKDRLIRDLGIKLRPIIDDKAEKLIERESLLQQVGKMQAIKVTEFFGYGQKRSRKAIVLKETPEQFAARMVNEGSLDHAIAKLLALKQEAIAKVASQEVLEELPELE